jgi:2-oxoisovalerate dehydrogenase E2 component (dihydrolipoyl transacylase)
VSRHVFRVPDIGEGSAEVELVKWHVNPGDRVEEDQIIADLMTEKATVETPSPVAGRVVQCHGTVGQMLAVGSPLLELELADSEGSAEPVVPQPPPTASSNSAPPVTSPREAQPALERETQTTAKSPSNSTPPAAAARVSQLPISTRPPDEKPIASPAVRAKAHAKGITLQYVAGSGPGGRITHEDLEHHISAAATRAMGSRPVGRREPNTSIDDVPVIGLRRRIAQQMQESKKRIPHFSYVEEVDVTDLEDFRLHLNENRRADQPKLTLLPFIIRALVQTLPLYPQVNARFDDDGGIVHRYGGVHVGIATQTPNGLVVPVLRHAEARGLWDLANEIARLARATRAGTAGRDELSGSTITVTSLGPLGGLSHTPIINHPEVAILGPNKIIERVVVKDGEFSARKTMNISSSFDHRVVDGWDAASFIQELRKLLERPTLMFMDAA